MLNTNRFLVGRVALVIWASGFILVLSGCAGSVVPWWAPLVTQHRQDCLARGGEAETCRQQAYDEWERLVVQYPCCAGSVASVPMSLPPALGPMPTGQVPYGTLTPTPMMGQYWVTGQPTGTVHAK